MDLIEFNLEAGIPTLDLRRYTEGDEADRKAFAAELGAHRQVGFAAISGHGVLDLIANMYKEVKDFFSLPTETKLNTAIKKKIIRGVL